MSRSNHASRTSCRKMFASRGEITPPCGVPASGTIRSPPPAHPHSATCRSVGEVRRHAPDGAETYGDARGPAYRKTAGHQAPRSIHLHVARAGFARSVAPDAQTDRVGTRT